MQIPLMRFDLKLLINLNYFEQSILLLQLYVDLLAIIYHNYLIVSWKYFNITTIKNMNR